MTWPVLIWPVLVIGAALVAAAVLLLPMTRGGMRRFCTPLVTMLAGKDPRCRVEMASNRTMVLLLETGEGRTCFRITQTPIHLVVMWTNDSAVTGTHARAWSFFKFTSQRAMKDRIYDDLLIAHRDMVRS